MDPRLVAIVPCTDLDGAQAFFERLDFARDPDSPDGYRMMSDHRGGRVHLTAAVEGWLVPGQNPFGLYLYREDVDALAERFAGRVIEREGPSAKPWGMYEFAVNGPDDLLVRVGWPTRLRPS